MFTTNRNQTIVDQYTVSVIEHEFFIFFYKIQVINERNTNVFKSRGCPDLKLKRSQINKKGITNNE